nr:ComEC/Rec2 family competence protein [uncultured Holophaga sp.]
MLSREGIWHRISSSRLWPLAWALVPACALPWVLPEDWSGVLPLWSQVAGWLLMGCCLLLAHYRLGRGPALAVLVGWLTLLGMAREARREAALPQGLVEVVGALDEPWLLQGERRTGHLTVAEPSWLAGVGLPLSLPREGVDPPEPGATVRFRGEWVRVEPAPAFLGERPLWRARSSGRARRVHLRSALLMEVLAAPRPPPLLRFRLLIQRRFEALGLPPAARDLWGALALGLPPARDEVFSAFSESGTIHTLVVSGLQVTLVMVLALWIWGRLLGRGGPWAAALSGVLYALVVGLSAPVWRGLLMGLAWILGRQTGWKLSPVLTLHGALLAWLLTHPSAGSDPGFLLSWWALLSLLWGAEPLAGLFSPLLGRLAMPLTGVLAPWLATLPLLALFHGCIPLYGVVANILILPLVVLLTPLCLGLLVLPVPRLVPAVAAVLGWTGEHLVPCFARVVPVATGHLWPWLLLCLGWILLAHRQATLRRTRALAVGLAGGTLGLLALGGTGRAPRCLSLESVEVGQGDALILRVPGGGATVVDTGGSPWSARRLVRVLSRRGVREPVHLLLTHPHGDHAGGASTLMRLWPMASLRGSALGHPEPWSSYLPELPHAFGLLRGAKWKRGEADFSVRWPPCPLVVPDANMMSAVLRVRWRDRELWLMGDALAIQEGDLLDLGDPGEAQRHRLLKPGHHGGAGASSPRWVAALGPELALVTAGRRNPFGHPDREALDHLAAVGCQVMVTGAHRGFRIEALPGGWQVEGGDGTRAWVSLRPSPGPSPRSAGSSAPRSSQDP